MEPGAYISLVQVAFSTAQVALKTFRNGLNYGTDAERLVLNLELEKFRLQVWGENSGLLPTDEEGATLPDRLEPVFGLLKEHLDKIVQLLENADGLRDRYGLESTQESPTSSERVRSVMGRIQGLLQKSGERGETNDNSGRAAETHDDDEPIPLAAKGKRRTNTMNIIRWAIKDLDKFEKLVSTLGKIITKLNKLLTETQQRKTTDDNRRIDMIVVGSAVDESSLELIRDAVRSASETSELRARIERKALLGNFEEKGLAKFLAPKPLSLADFTLPDNFSATQRFITTKVSGLGITYLLERKDFDRDISAENKKKLAYRVQRLVMLLRRPKSPGFATPEAEGCIHDPASSCWWMVFRFPLESTLPESPAQSPSFPAPVSLLSLLQPGNRFRPPLEHRLSLASSVCKTFSELYSSSWLHKGVRSENILFGISTIPEPTCTPSQYRKLLDSFTVCGFEYSRHESEWETIDKAKMSGNVPVAIYRHPNYQGEAAEGYKLQYDIYSLGLVLIEIAFWMPLATFLEGKPAGDKAKTNSDDQSASLSADMKYFHALHAVELKRRATARAGTELAFRMGSQYHRAVKFCLEIADSCEELDGSDVPPHPALEFYDNVVIPLESACKNWG